MASKQKPAAEAKKSLRKTMKVSTGGSVVVKPGQSREEAQAEQAQAEQAAANRKPAEE